MNPEHTKKWHRAVGQMEEGCALLAGIMAGLGLWSWSAGFEDLLSFGSVFVPMAPSTALVMMVLSLAVFLVHRWPGYETVVRLAWWAAGLTAFVGLWATVRPWFGWDSPVEQWLARTTRRINHIPLGQMSPLTGVTFLAAALALGLRLLPPARLSKVRTPIAMLALVVVVTGLGVTGSYAIGRPGLLGGSAIPMALWTALAFLCLGLGLWGFAAVEPSPAANDLVARNRGLGPAQLAITSCLVVLLCLVGALHLRHTLHESVANAGDLLQAIADLKTTEVVKWRQRCLREAEFLSRASFVGQHVRDCVANPADPAARSRLRALFGLLQRGGRFAAVAFLDTNAVPHLVVPQSMVAESPFHRQWVTGAFRSNSIVMSDLHQDGFGKHIYLALAVPVMAPDEANVPLPTIRSSQPLGALLLHFDASHFLNPLIRSWPSLSSTAETVLVRREEGELIFLNEVRHRGGAAVNLRLPLSENSQSPSVRAVLGETGVVEGVDYRGVRVLAAIRAIPGTPWFIATQMDREEVFAFLYEQAWLTLALTVVLAAAAGMVVNLAGQHRKVADMRRELALAQRVEHLMKNANDAILLMDADLRIVEANDRAAETYGYAQAELRNLSLADLRAPEGRTEHDRNIAQLMATGHAVFESVYRRKDGSVFPAENSARVIDIAGVSYRLAMLRDITERKAQERELGRMNRLYHTLSEINQSIVRLQTREELFHSVCQITAEFAGFDVVWLGWLDPETQEIKPVGRAGARQAYLDTVKVYADDRPEGGGRLAPASAKDARAAFKTWPTIRARCPASKPWLFMDCVPRWPSPSGWRGGSAGRSRFVRASRTSSRRKKSPSWKRPRWTYRLRSIPCSTRASANGLRKRCRKASDGFARCLTP